MAVRGEGELGLWAARGAVALFLLLWLGPGLLPGKRLTVSCYLATTGAWARAAPAEIPLPVVPDQSCYLIDYPNLLWAHRHLREARAPLLLPVGGGIPFLANPQAAPGSLWHMPAVVTGSLYAHSWSFALRAALAAAFGWILARRLGLEPFGRAVVAGSTAAAGMMASQFLMTNPSPVVLLPLLLLLGEGCSARRDGRSAVVFGGIAGLAPLWGHPEPAFLAVMGAGLWWALREMTGRDWTAAFWADLAGRAALAAGVCGMVAAPAVLPFAVQLPRSVTYKLAVSPSLGQTACGGALLVAGVAALVLLRRHARRREVLEGLWRRPRGRAWLVLGLVGAVAISLLLDPYELTNVEAFPRGHAVDLRARLLDPAHLQHLYPGLVLLPFVAAGWGRLRALRPALAGMIVLGLGLGWSVPPFDLVRLVPGLGTMGFSYAAPLLTLPLALLGGAGLEALAGRPRRLAVYATAGAGLALLWHGIRARAVDPLAVVMTEPRALLAAASVGAVLLALWALPRRRTAAMAILVLLDLLLHAYPYARPMPPFPFPRTPAVRAVEEILAEGGRFVALSDPERPVPALLPPNTGAALGLPDARMAGAMRPRALMELWGPMAMPDPHPNLLLTAEPDGVVWDLLDVRAVLAAPQVEVPARYELAYGDSRINVWRRPLLSEGEEPKRSYQYALSDRGIEMMEKPDLSHDRPSVLLHWTHWDRWAGILGPVLFLVGAGVLVTYSWRSER